MSLGRSSGNRRSPAPWDRLRSVSSTGLSAYGLPSKGDNRLLDRRTQEQYFSKIVERYMAFCGTSSTGSELDDKFASLSLTPSDSTTPAPTPASSSASITSDTSTELSALILAMRKLREGLVASHRIDAFAIQAYVFSIRAAILMKHMESYHPALLHLLYRIHPRHPLSSIELTEFAGYLTLDAACRLGDLSRAYTLRRQFALKDARVDAVLSALAHGNYFVWQKAHRAVDVYKRRMMEPAADRMMLRSLKCLGKSYFTLPIEYLERITGTNWEDLVSRFGVGWEKGDDGVVVLRRPKPPGKK